jgi:hypothetical protein
MDIFNDVQLQQILEQKARNVLEKSSKEILKMFKDEYVQKYVYDSHGDNKEYSETLEFKESWVFTNIEKKANELVTTMFSNPALMSFNPTEYSTVGTHGSTFGNPNDVRPYLSEILDKNLSSSLYVSVFRSTRYWNKFLEDHIYGDGLRNIFNKHCLAEGLTPGGFSVSFSQSEVDNLI